MKAGAVIVDVAIDQGGCFKTSKLCIGGGFAGSVMRFMEACHSEDINSPHC